MRRTTRVGAQRTTKDNIGATENRQARWRGEGRVGNTSVMAHDAGSRREDSAHTIKTILLYCCSATASPIHTNKKKHDEHSSKKKRHRYDNNPGTRTNAIRQDKDPQPKRRHCDNRMYCVLIKRSSSLTL